MYIMERVSYGKHRYFCMLGVGATLERFVQRQREGEEARNIEATGNIFRKVAGRIKRTTWTGKNTSKFEKRCQEINRRFRDLMLDAYSIVWFFLYRAANNHGIGINMPCCKKVSNKRSWI